MAQTESRQTLFIRTLVFHRICIFTVLLGASTCCLQAQTPLTVTLSPGSPGRTIPSDFEGISIEMFSVVDVGTTSYPTSNAPVDDLQTAWFGNNSTLGVLMQTLGVKSLRVGGTTTEKPTLLDKNATYPQPYDAAHVSNFAQQYGMGLIWALPAASTYNLNTFTTFAENMVSVQQSKGQNFKMVFEIGNEPDIQDVGASTYDSRFDAYVGALRSGIGTSTLVLGPSEVEHATYIDALMADPEYDSSTAPYHENVAAFSHHLYPFGGQSSVNGAIQTMLANNVSNYTNNYNSWAATAESYGYSTRYDEANSFSGGGYLGASNAFAAALWGLDILEFHSHNTTLSGMNFHVGTIGGSYAPFSPQSLSPTYTTEGLGYGMLAFATGGVGQVIPTTSSDSSLNVTAYGTLLSNGSETVAVINKTTVIAGDNTNVVLTVVPGNSYKTASVYYLQAPNNDPTQTTGITFGGASVSGTGTWSGRPTAFSANANGSFTIPLSASEAAVIKMTN